MRNTTNVEIAEILYEIAQHLEMQDVPFKPRAYEKVAGVIEGLEEEVAEKTGHSSESGDARIEAIEKRLNEIHETPVKVSRQTEHALKISLAHEFSKEMRDLEKRVHTLEALLEKKGQQEIEETDTDMLSDIQKILKGMK